PRSVPAIAIAVAVVVVLVASAVGLGTGVINLTGARNVLPSSSVLAIAGTPNADFVDASPSLVPASAVPATSTPGPTPTPTPRAPTAPPPPATVRDQTPPGSTSIKIAGGKATVYDSLTVTLSLTASDPSKPLQMRLANQI